MSDYEPSFPPPQPDESPSERQKRMIDQAAQEVRADAADAEINRLAGIVETERLIGQVAQEVIADGKRNAKSSDPKIQELAINAVRIMDEMGERLEAEFILGLDQVARDNGFDPGLVREAMKDVIANSVDIGSQRVSAIPIPESPSEPADLVDRRSVLDTAFKMIALGSPSPRPLFLSHNRPMSAKDLARRDIETARIRELLNEGGISHNRPASAEELLEEEIEMAARRRDFNKGGDRTSTDFEISLEGLDSGENVINTGPRALSPEDEREKRIREAVIDLVLRTPKLPSDEDEDE